MEEFVAYGLTAFFLFYVFNPLGIILVIAGYVRNLIWLKITGFFLILAGTGAFALFKYIY